MHFVGFVQLDYAVIDSFTQAIVTADNNLLHSVVQIGIEIAIDAKFTDIDIGITHTHTCTHTHTQLYTYKI